MTVDVTGSTNLVTYTAHETNAHEEDEEPYSEEEDSCTEESDLTSAFEREMHALASTVEKLEESLWMLKTWKICRELFGSTYEGLATTRETHTMSREENEESRLSAFLIVPLLSQPSVLVCHLRVGRVGGKTRPKGGSVNQKETRYTVFRLQSSPTLVRRSHFVLRRTGTSLKHRRTSRVASLTELFMCVPNLVLPARCQEQELRGAGACDTCCTRTVAGQEWVNVHVRSLKQFQLKYWTLPRWERFKFGAGDPVVCKSAYLLPVMVHGACAIMRVSVVSRRHFEGVGSPIRLHTHKMGICLGVEASKEKGFERAGQDT